MPMPHRSISQIIEEQANRWELARRAQPTEPPWRPVVTISREHGAGGDEVARRLAEELKLDLFDREILQAIADSAHLSERVVSALDERSRSQLTDWLAAFTSEAYLSPVGYLEHLLRVVGAIARHGGAVIVGRGAHLMLGGEQAVRVLVTAPLPVRVANVCQQEGVSEREARRRVAEVDAERRAFLLRHFHADPADITRFDLVVNTAVLGTQGAVATVRAALAGLEERHGAARAAARSVVV